MAFTRVRVHESREAVHNYINCSARRYLMDDCCKGRLTQQKASAIHFDTRFLLLHDLYSQRRVHTALLARSIYHLHKPAPID
jgi:hypothetical protein